MSWGWKITILYVGFVALILTLVFTSMNNKSELVSTDYYAQELKYQQRIDALNNTSTLENPITYSVNGKAVELLFPEEIRGGKFSGEVYFFRPSDAGKDVKFAMKPDADGKQRIQSDQLLHGSYKMQLSWQQDGKKYFKEEVIFLQ